MSLNTEQKELISALNGRLKESAKFWYQCADEYHSVDDFSASLNALIQSLRNITWILQSHKRLIPGFDVWYKDQQEEMKKDSILKRLNEARIEVVKIKDLKRKSYAVISLMNWENMPLLQWEVDPVEDMNKISLPPIPNELKELFSKKYREPLVRIERKWIVEELSEFEVLQTLAYCYKKLRNVIAESYKKAGIDLSESEIDKIEKDSYLLLGETPENKRIAYFNLQYDHITFENKEIKITEESIKEAEDRYKSPELEKLKKLIKGEDSLADFAYYLLNAKTILKKDGNHIPLVLLYFNNRKPEILPIPAENRTGLYAQIRNLATKIKANRSITGIIIINEMWVSSFEQYKERGIFPTDNPERKELLSVVAIRSDGYAKISMEVFNRNNNEINFEDTEVDMSGECFLSLEPIFKAWNLTGAQIKIIK